MAGFVNDPDRSPADTLQDVSRVLSFLALGAESIGEARERVCILPDDYEGLTILLRACKDILEEVAKKVEEPTSQREPCQRQP